MSTILFVTIDAGGNVPPALAIARELAARGHRIVFLAHAGQKGVIEGAGFGFTPFADARAWDHSKPSSAVRTISDYAYAASSRRMIHDFLTAARAVKADLAVVDCMLPGIVGSARTIGLPCAVLFHSFYAFWNGPWANGPVGRLAQLRGANARKAWAGADLEIVASDPVLDPASSAATGRRIWTGVAETATPRAVRIDEVGTDEIRTDEIRTDERKRILVSLSTLWLPGQAEVYRSILAALGRMPVDAIVTTAGQATPEYLNAPSNVRVVGYVDHAEILPTVDLVVCHGGHSTTMRAAISGIPVLVIPMHPLIDQPMIGTAIQKAGLGLTLSKKSTPAEVGEALTTILGTRSYRSAAAQAAQRHQAGGSASAAADALVPLLESRNATRSQ
jgi:UDP:flavonoid glycosyltransferase YjiC (YdhE family)